MGAEKTAADLLGDDPTFKDYFKKTDVKKNPVPKPIEPDLLPKIVTRKTNPVENPLAEYGIPAPGSTSAINDKYVAYVKYGFFTLLVGLGLLVLFAVFKLMTAK